MIKFPAIKKGVRATKDLNIDLIYVESDVRKTVNIIVNYEH